MTQEQPEIIVTGTGFNLTERRRRVLDFVKAHPNCTTSEVCIGLSLHLMVARRVLYELRDHKYVGQQGGALAIQYESRWLAERRNDT